MASEDIKVEDVVSAVPTEEVVVETPKVEVKTVDARAVQLASEQEAALSASVAREGEIEAGKKLSFYALAGIAHAATACAWKASMDYADDAKGVAHRWNSQWYKDAIGQITTRLRATNPEIFADDEGKATSQGHERINVRLKVGLMYNELKSLIGEKVGNLPYRIVANYLVFDSVKGKPLVPGIFKFSETEVAGEVRAEHAEFLKRELGLVCDGKSTSASFHNALAKHYDDLEKEAIAKANSMKTPEELKLAASAVAAAAEGAETADKVNKVRKGLATYVASACSGMMTPDEIGDMIGQAAKKQGISIPISKLNPETISKDELDRFLSLVASHGGKTQEERNKLRMTIVRHGTRLQDAANKRKEAAVAGKQPALAAV